MASPALQILRDDFEMALALLGVRDDGVTMVDLRY
jgi:hypothetical protein